MRVGIIFLLAATLTGAFAQDRSEYILLHKDIAIDEMRRIGIPASIKLAQAILESNAGASDLARKANNHFGIKCGNDWRGRQFMKKDDDRNARGKLVRSCFRMFGSAEESFVAHSEFLADPRKETRYGFLFDLNPMDYKAWARGLKRAGYATNPRYPQLLIRIIEDYALDRYDALALEAMADNPPAGDRRKTRKEDTHRAQPKSSRRSYVVQYQNKVRFALARAGDTPESLARDLDIPVDRLEHANENIFDPHQQLEQGDRVYLQRKKAKYKGTQRYHIVKDGETMQMIAHSYGMRTKALHRLNGVPMDEEPVIGERLSLREKNKEGVATRPQSSSPVLHVSTKPGQPLMLDPITPEEALQQQALIAENEVPAPQTPQDEEYPEPRPDEPENQPKVVQPITPLLAEDTLYTVQPKDTLYRIARDHGLTVDHIRKLNKLEGDTIHPGQQLRLSGS